jgi:hypothetical protein
MLGFYYYTTLIIREWILVKSPIPRNEPDLRRYEVYQRCADSIKAWLGIFFSMPFRMYTSVPCSFYSQLCYVVVFLHQVTATRDANWDSAAARKVVDLLPAMNKIIHSFEQVKAASMMDAASGGEDQALCLIIKKFQGLKTAWQSELGPEDTGQDPIQEAATLDAWQGPFSFEPMDPFNFHMLPNMLDNIPWQ